MLWIYRFSELCPRKSAWKNAHCRGARVSLSILCEGLLPMNIFTMLHSSKNNWSSNIKEHKEIISQLIKSYFRHCSPLKWQSHEIFDIFLFHESNPPGPLINRLKWKIRSCGDIREISDSALTNTARSRIFRT